MTLTITEHDIEIVDAATRREFLVMLGAAGLLAACGGNGADRDVAGGSAGETITVENQFGTFEVPREPQRVVGWEGRRDLETTLALGLTPVGVGDNALFGGDELAPFIDLDLDSVEVIVQVEPNLELIASLRPDLILTRDSNIEELLDELRPLAPLVPVKPDGPWRPDLEAIAEALDRRDRLADVLAGYDERRAEVRARHGERIDSAVLAVVQYFADDRFYASSTTGFYLQANTLADLGGNHLPFLEAGGAIEDEGFSVEQTEQLAGADAIVLITNEQADRDDLFASPLWQGLPAVQAERVVDTDFRTNYGSVYAATACLDLLDRTYQTLA